MTISGFKSYGKQKAFLRGKKQTRQIYRHSSQKYGRDTRRQRVLGFLLPFVNWHLQMPTPSEALPTSSCLWYLRLINKAYSYTSSMIPKLLSCSRKKFWHF